MAFVYTWLHITRRVRQKVEHVSNETAAQNAEFSRNGNGLHWQYIPHTQAYVKLSTLWLEVIPQGPLSQCPHYVLCVDLCNIQAYQCWIRKQTQAIQLHF